jgi:hypothetical protein
MKLVYAHLKGLTHIGTEYGLPCCGAGARFDLAERIEPDGVLTCFECMQLPWLHEPEGAAFEHAGYACTLKRGGSGAWCGYVDIPRTHPLAVAAVADEDLIESTIDVHGGVTFTGTGVDAGGKPDTLRIGFDCGHSSDWSPDMPMTRSHGAVYRTIEYASDETRRLAEQLAKIAAEGLPP